MPEMKPTLESVRSMGQVWTPSWVADAMATYLKGSFHKGVLDPAVGPGALVAACKRFSNDLPPVDAFEIDMNVLSSNHSENTFAKDDFRNMYIESFLLSNREEKYANIIANPPYLRHHKMPSELKELCKEITQKLLGITIDARAGLHVYFLLKALSQLEIDGKLVYLLPADVFEGVFAEKLWSAINAKFRIEGILTFSKDRMAFPGVDTNAVIIMIANAKPIEKMLWGQWNGEIEKNFAKSVDFALGGNFVDAQKLGLKSLQVPISQAIGRGFTRSQEGETVEGVPFVEIATAVRGIATGDNDFFVFTRKRMKQFGLREETFVRTIMRVRDLPDSGLCAEDLEELDSNGRPTYLLSIDSETSIYPELLEYLKSGEATGVNQGALVSARKTWYFMEKRKPVPILFAYLGRRNVRFTRVNTVIQPLTGFLCVYPLAHIDADQLAVALNHPSTILELSKVGKSYGDGAIKVEPGGLRKLVVPWDAIYAAKLEVHFRIGS